jgi:hypothetical protein
VQCTRCPAALDKLNGEASRNIDVNLQFVSICLGGRPDDAREVIEQTSIPRWNDFNGHYQMNHESKETMKSILNFKMVPYYLVFNQRGQRTISAATIDVSTLHSQSKLSSTSSFNYSSRISQNLMTAAPQAMTVDTCPSVDPLESDSDCSDSNYDDDLSMGTKTVSRSTSPMRVFEIDDLDF